MHEQQEPQHSSFLTGFTVGLFAGAAGFYLYGTERGQKLREHLVSEWQAAKVEFAKEGLIERPEVSIREFAHEIFAKMMGAQKTAHPTQTEHRLLAETNKPYRRTASSFYRPKKTSPPPKFRNV